MQSANRLLNLYVCLFLLFMFTPLLLLMIASVNDVSPPSATDWRGFTWKWYAFFTMDEDALRADPVLRMLDRDRLLSCLGNSLWVTLWVVPMSLILGISGALALSRLQTRAQGLLWWILLSPMLAPGVILGLSTLIFWTRFGVDAGLTTIILAQITFIAGYPMLIVMARLQRQPPEHEQAALDLGASPWQVLTRITLPYLAPAIVSAAVIAFLASFENYNTTMFAKGGSCTFSTELGAMSRNPNGHPPVINAVGTAIIILTFVFALLHAFRMKQHHRT